MFKTVISNLKRRRNHAAVYRALTPHFDCAFYERNNPDLSTNDDFLTHYVNIGWLEGRDPTPWFSTSAYLIANPDVQESGINPFFHYIKHGRNEHRQLKSEAQELLIDSLMTYATSRSDKTAKNTIGYLISIRDALQESGIYSDTLIQKFSASDYRWMVNGAFDTCADYLMHFATFGYKQLLPLSFEHYFDTDFYQTYNPDAKALSTVNAYIHWLAKGLPSDCPPNSTRLLQKLGLNGTNFPEHFDVELYRYNNDDLVDEARSDWNLLEHFITKGAFERRCGCPLNYATSDIYVAAADYAAIMGRDREAQRIYEAVLKHAPKHARALNHLGDCCLRQELFGAGIAAYRSRLESKSSGVYTYWNLVTCLESSYAPRDALEVIESAIKAFPGDYGLRRRRREVLRHMFEDEMSLAQSYAKAMRRGVATKLMSKAVDDLSVAVTGAEIARPRRDNITRLAILGDYSLPQCRFYRIDQKLEQLAIAGITAEAFDASIDCGTLAGRIHEFDGIIFYRAPAWIEILELISCARSLGIVTFYEIDDLIFEPDHFPDNYGSFCGLVTREEYAALVIGAPAFRGALQACDYGIASTAPLARYMKKYVRSGEVFIHRNGLGNAHYQAIKVNSGCKTEHRGEIVIFYGTGTKAHKRDFTDVAGPVFERLFHKYGARLRLILAGYTVLPEVLAPFARLIDLQNPRWNAARFWEILASSDINIAIISRSEMVDCKSEIKWLEASMLGIPSVLSRTANYDDTIEDGKTGYLVESHEEWFNTLDSLIMDSDLRRRIGEAARQVVLKRYDKFVMAKNLTGILESVSTHKHSNVRRKRVLIVNVWYPPQAIGGATRVVHDNVRDLTSRHGELFDIEVFTTLEGDPEPYKIHSYLVDGVRVTAISTPSDPDVGVRAVDRKMGEAFERFLSHCQPDLIHFHGLMRLTASLPFVAHEAGIPYIITVHDGWWISERQFLIDELGRTVIYSQDDNANVGRFGASAAERARTLRLALERACRIIAVSDSFAEIYRAAGFANVLTISNGVTALPERKRTPSSDRRVRLGFIGGMEHHKGYSLIEAAIRNGKHSNLRLTVVDHSQGLGEERQEIWGDTLVSFTGRCAQDQVCDLYGSLDVLLAPSIWPESYGLVTREALHFGLWVVASNRGAVGEYVVENRNGFIIDVETTRDLENVLATINADPEKFRNSPDYEVQMRYSFHQADELARLYRDLTGARLH